MRNMECHCAQSASCRMPLIHGIAVVEFCRCLVARILKKYDLHIFFSLAVGFHEISTTIFIHLRISFLI